MYAHCIHCQAPLGANEALERFPVGRKLAFDAARGRLWVVCPRCAQWSLTPLEERWEAIEEGERLFRDATRRVSTGEIGLARLADGTELVRIGEPMRPEFAAWRYGPRFRQRYRRQILVGSALVTAGAAWLYVGPVLGAVAAGAWGLPLNLWSLAVNTVGSRRVVGRFEDASGPATVTSWQLRGLKVRTGRDGLEDVAVEVPVVRQDVPVGRFGKAHGVDSPKLLLTGPEALRALKLGLVQTNAGGAGQRTVEEAVRWVERSGGQHRLLREASGVEGGDIFRGPSTVLAELPLPLRLALEMAAHEEDERRAMEGELAALEAAWREAEEVARIADELTLPEWVTARVARLGGG